LRVMMRNRLLLYEAWWVTYNVYSTHHQG